MIEEFFTALGELDTPMTALEFAEALWLAESLPGDLTATPGAWLSAISAGSVEYSSASPAQSPRAGAGGGATEPSGTLSGQVAEGSGPVSARLQTTAGRSVARITGIPVFLPTAPALANALVLSGALRPLRRRHPSKAKTVLDEDATAIAIADYGLWSPRYKPSMDRWLGLTLIVDQSSSMAAWSQYADEFRLLLERLGAFRRMRTWYFDSDDERPIEYLNGETPGSRHRPKELVSADGRGLILVISNCIGAAWGTGTVAKLLQTWSGTAPVAVLQPMPARLWPHCACRFTKVSFEADRPGLATSQLEVTAREPMTGSQPSGQAIPVLEMDPRGHWIGSWARLVVGQVKVPGVALYTGSQLRADRDLDQAGPRDAEAEKPPTALERVQRFRAKASPAAFLLAGYLAATPLSMPVMRLVQEAMLPRSQPAHLAEVLLSDLVYSFCEASSQDPWPQFEFHDGVREVLLAGLQRADTVRVIEKVTQFIGPRLESPLGFRAILEALADGTLPVSLPFARVLPAALRALGGNYAEVADKIEHRLAMAQEEATAQEEHEPRYSPDPVGEPAAGDDLLLQARSNDVSLPADFSPVPERLPRQPAGWHTVPRGTSSFIGREDLLFKLHTQIGQSMTALVPHTVYGLGGVGKTQLAIQYAWRFRSEYDLVWWIPAEHHNQIISSLVKLASLMNLQPAENHENTVSAVLNSLSDGVAYKRWLLIYDNAGPPDYIRDYVPTGGGHILVTSLSQEWVGGEARAIQIDVFTRQESIDLLRRYLEDISDEDADRIAKRLGDLPLAIEHAAIWLGRGGMTAAEYIDELDNIRQETLNRLVTTNHPQPVVETWGFAFNELAGDDEPAALLLRLCAFFGPGLISTQVLYAGHTLAGIPDQIRDVIGNSIRLHDAMQKIGRYGLASAQPGKGLLVHRLVQAVLREQISKEEQASYRQLAHLILAAANPGHPDDEPNWAMLEMIGTHVVKSTGLMHSDDADVRKVVLDQMRYRYVRGDYDSSRTLADRARTIWAGKYPADRLFASYYLGNALRGLGKYREALEINRETRTLLMASPEAEEQLLLRVNSSYGADLRINGDYKEALRLDEENLKRYIALGGPDDRNTLRCQNNLAVDFRLKGDFRKALEHDDRILGVRIRKFGEDDQDTLFAQCMKARDLRGCGNYRESLDLFEAVLPKYRDLLGESHQDVLHARLSYSVTLYRMGKYSHSRDEIEECLLRFHSDHPGSMMARTILASAMRLLGFSRLACSEATKAHDRATSLFGADHLFTWLYAHNLAIAKRASDEHQEAKELDERTMPRIREVLGAHHPFALSSMASLASSRSSCGDLKGARELSKRVYELSLKVRGAQNPLTLMCARNLELDMKALGQNGEATARATVAIRELADVLGSNNRLVRTLADGQRYEFDIQPPQV